MGPKGAPAQPLIAGREQDFGFKRQQVSSFSEASSRCGAAGFPQVRGNHDLRRRLATESQRDKVSATIPAAPSGAPRHATTKPYEDGFMKRMLLATAAALIATAVLLPHWNSRPDGAVKSHRNIPSLGDFRPIRS